MRPVEASNFASSNSYSLLPFRFARIPGRDRILLTNEVGELLFLREQEFSELVSGTLSENNQAADELESKHFLYRESDTTAIRFLAAKLRTKKSFLRGGPSLHIFVVTLRCDHSCHYCQVSRQSSTASKYDMSHETMIAAVDRLFECPSNDITVEFQGGEPLLALSQIKFVVDLILHRNEVQKKRIMFSIATTLHHLNDEALDLFRKHNFQVSTSLDGPARIHNLNRPNPTRNSYDLTIEGIAQARSALGQDRVSALTTLTRLSLEYPEAIVDEYVAQKFPSVFLRPLSPFGFAVRSRRKLGYDAADYIRFYERALTHILGLNKSGISITEVYASILLASILTPYPTTYVDLRSPIGGAFGCIVYNYDGDVYASDEGRMLAETGDFTYRLGHVSSTYSELMKSNAVELLAASGLAEVSPGCSDCAFVPYCGLDPVSSTAACGEPIEHRAFSEHCRRHTGLFQILFRHLGSDDTAVFRIMRSWAMNSVPTAVET